MRVEIRDIELSGADADLVVVGVAEGSSAVDQVGTVPGAAEAKGTFKELSLLHRQGASPLLVVGLGKPEDLDAERFRIAAAVAAKEAGRLEATSLAWLLPDEEPLAAVEGVVTGTILGAYRFDRFRGTGAKEDPPPRLDSLTLL